MDAYRSVDEDLFRLLAANVVDYAILLLDDKGRVTTWGVGAERIKGYKPDEIIGQHFSVFYPPKEVAAGKPAWELEEATVTGRLEDEGWRVRKDGSRFWANVVITAMRDSKGTLIGFGKVTRDLTDRKLAEEKLRDEIEIRRGVEEELRSLNQELEERVRTRTAELESTNALLSAEIAERKRVEGQVSATQERLTGIIESAMDAIITTDESQRIILFNAAAQSLFGYTAGDAIGMSLNLLIPERFRKYHSLLVRQFGAEGITSRRMGTQRVVTAVRKDGTEFPIEASISQVAQRGNHFYTVILRDVTERLRNDQALHDSRAQVLEMASMAQTAREQEQGRIARELHDEMGQLLTSMKLDIASLHEHASDADAHRLDGIDRLLDSMVTATRRIAADLRPLMLDDLGFIPAAEWLLDSFNQRTDIDYAFDVEPRDLELPLPHATALYRILQESLTNIAKHAGASLVTVQVDASDSEVQLTVRDNGIGFNASGERKPLSFGLVGLRERAYFLGGDVWVTSSPGNGTEVRTRIPIQPEVVSVKEGRLD